MLRPDFKYGHICKELIHKIISFNKILMFSIKSAVVLQNKNEKNNNKKHNLKAPLKIIVA